MHITKKFKFQISFKTGVSMRGLHKYSVVFIVWCYVIHWLIIVRKLDKLLHTYMK